MKIEDVPTVTTMIRFDDTDKILVEATGDGEYRLVHVNEGGRNAVLIQAPWDWFVRLHEAVEHERKLVEPKAKSKKEKT